MSRRGTGVLFCLIAALLFIARYISAAIYSSGISTWSAELFHDILGYVGGGLTICSAISLLVGIIYLVWAELNKE